MVDGEVPDSRPVGFSDAQIAAAGDTAAILQTDAREFTARFMPGEDVEGLAVLSMAMGKAAAAQVVTRGADLAHVMQAVDQMFRRSLVTEMAVLQHRRRPG
jgi:hypothetical protein